MGGYYVPNIQRPGFGYKRRGDNDEEWGDDDSQPGGGLFSSGMDWQSSQQPDNSFASAASTGDTSAPASRGGAGVTPPAVGTPEPEYATGSEDAPPAPAPKRTVPEPVAPAYQPYKPGAEQQALKDMIKKGPKRSILGTIAAAAAGAGAGWVNAAGRTHVPVPTQAMRNMTWRAPGGGAWDTKLGQQGQLAQMEQAEDQRKMATEQMQAQAEERKAQAAYYKQHGDYLGEQTEISRTSKAEQAKNDRFQRIMQLGGRGSTNIQRVEIPPGGKLPAGDGWYTDTNPYKPGWRIAVRPNPGREVPPEEGKRLGVMPDSQGKYYATEDRIKDQNQIELGQAKAAQAVAETEARTERANADRARQAANDASLAGYRTTMTDLAASGQADRKAAKERDEKDRQDKALAGAEESKKNLLIGANKWAEAERAKVRRDLGGIPAADEARIKKGWLAQIQAAYNSYGATSRQYGGAAYDVRVDEEGNPIPITGGYLKGQKPTPLPGEEEQPTPPTPPKPPAAPVTGPGRGGAGGAGPGGGPGRGAVPPKVNTAQAKTISKAEVQAFADEFYKGDYAKAEKVYTDKQYKVLP